MLTNSQKIYLYAIYSLAQKCNPIRLAEVAKIVGVSKPSTVNMMQKLLDDGYILKEPYSDIKLTPKGVKSASDLYTAVVVISEFLKKKMGVSDYNADKDSITMVSQLSDETLRKFMDLSING